MKVPIQITFHGVPHSDPLSRYVEKRAEKLDSLCDRITSCRVAIESPHTSHTHGNRFRVRIDLVIPGRELVVDHAREASEDAYSAVDSAFDDMKRRLRDALETQRDKQRAQPGITDRRA